MAEHLCLTCKYAEWKRTRAGDLHPSGDGRCVATFKIDLPRAFFWSWGRRSAPYDGGWIERRPDTHFTECSFYDAIGEGGEVRAASRSGEP